jgi:hypothetical protein
MTHLSWLKEVSQESEQQKLSGTEIVLNLKYINWIDLN